MACYSGYFCIVNRGDAIPEIAIGSGIALVAVLRYYRENKDSTIA